LEYALPLCPLSCSISPFRHIDCDVVRRLSVDARLILIDLFFYIFILPFGVFFPFPAGSTSLDASRGITRFSPPSIRRSRRPVSFSSLSEPRSCTRVRVSRHFIPFGFFSDRPPPFELHPIGVSRSSLRDFVFCCVNCSYEPVCIPLGLVPILSPHPHLVLLSFFSRSSMQALLPFPLDVAQSWSLDQRASVNDHRDCGAVFLTYFSGSPHGCFLQSPGFLQVIIGRVIVFGPFHCFL